ncbi:MAG: hypothetical protein M1816_004809 [Peltula sp. TS41687]|nr:MAG: hypothetical protein M1816_004809 [Peltula sp. TS41687]
MDFNLAWLIGNKPIANRRAKVRQVSHAESAETCCRTELCGTSARPQPEPIALLYSPPQVLLLHLLEGSTTSMLGSTADSFHGFDQQDSVKQVVTMSYGFDTKRDEAYTEGPLSSATMTLMRVAGGWGKSAGQASCSTTAMSFGLAGATISAIMFRTASIPFIISTSIGFIDEIRPIATELIVIALGRTIALKASALDGSEIEHRTQHGGLEERIEQTRRNECWDQNLDEDPAQGSWLHQ